MTDSFSAGAATRQVDIIAEIGINHNGDLGTAKQLIDMAKATGCDAVKFQKRTIDQVYTPEFLDSPRESPWGRTQRSQKEGLEFGRAEYNEIDAYCRSLGIEWMASAWDVDSQLFVRSYSLPRNKVASAMIGHLALLEAIAAEGKPTFISTGMSGYDQIDRAVELFRRRECPFTLLHCVGEYPAKPSSLNLLMIPELQRRYDCPVGYSGHEAGVNAAVLASLIGAVAIERHITLDRSMYGSDQAASLEKRGLELMVGYIRSIPTVLGDGVKRISAEERGNAEKLRYYSESAEAASPAFAARGQ